MQPGKRGRIEELLEWLGQSGEVRCPRCAGPVSAHELVMDHALGYRDAPRCAPCLASELGRDRGEFLEHVLDYIQHKKCYRVGWEWAGTRAGLGACLRPPHLWVGEGVRGP